MTWRRSLTWFVLSLAIVQVALSLALTRENRGLKRQLAALSMSESGFAGCRLPAMQATDLKGIDRTITFPRTHSLLILSASRDCIYCESSWKQWSLLIRSLPDFVEAVVLDGKRSMTHEYASAVGIPSETVLSLGITPPEIVDFTRQIPTVLLISRSGTVMGRWTGTLTLQKVKVILASIRDTL